MNGLIVYQENTATDLNCKFYMFLPNNRLLVSIKHNRLLISYRPYDKLLDAVAYIQDLVNRGYLIIRDRDAIKEIAENTWPNAIDILRDLEDTGLGSFNLDGMVKAEVFDEEVGYPSYVVNNLDIYPEIILNVGEYIEEKATAFSYRGYGIFKSSLVVPQQLNFLLSDLVNIQLMRESWAVAQDVLESTEFLDTVLDTFKSVVQNSSEYTNIYSTDFLNDEVELVDMFPQMKKGLVQINEFFDSEIINGLNRKTRDLFNQEFKKNRRNFIFALQTDEGCSFANLNDQLAELGTCLSEELRLIKRVFLNSHNSGKVISLYPYCPIHVELKQLKSGYVRVRLETTLDLT